MEVNSHIPISTVVDRCMVLSAKYQKNFQTLHTFCYAVFFYYLTSDTACVISYYIPYILNF